MKKTIKILLFSLLILLIFGMTEVNAASASIKASKTSATVGESVTVTVTINAATWNVSVNGSGISDKIVGYNEDAVNETKTKSYTLNTSTAGTYTISISGDITDESEAKSYPSDSVTVTVSEPAPVVTPEPEPPKPVQNNTSSNNSTPKPEVKKSSDSKLKALSVEGYQISPEFSADVKEYTLNVPYEVTSLDISASVNHSKATYSVSGEEELEVGENEVIVKGRAEDGSTTKYTIKVTRAREELHLTSIIAKIIDENGVITELPLNPTFSFDIFEYTLEEISHKIEKIEIEALANLEGATIEITGNENLQEGENTITITAKILNENIAEGEEETEEIKVYTIKVSKEAEPVVVPPTMMGTIKTFFNDNSQKVIPVALLVCSVAFVGLTIYLAVDYKKYKDLISKIAQLNKLNVEEVAQSIKPQEEIKEEKKVGKHF